MSQEFIAWLFAQGPAGVIILAQIYVIIFLFNKYDGAREEIVKVGTEYAKITALATKAIEQISGQSFVLVEAIQTLKLLHDIRRKSE